MSTLCILMESSIWFVTMNMDGCTYQWACTHPDSFVRGGSKSSLTKFFFVEEGREDPDTTIKVLAINGPQAKRHLNGVSLGSR